MIVLPQKAWIYHQIRFLRRKKFQKISDFLHFFVRWARVIFNHKNWKILSQGTSGELRHSIGVRNHQITFVGGWCNSFSKALWVLEKSRKNMIFMLPRGEWFSTIKTQKSDLIELLNSYDAQIRLETQK